MKELQKKNNFESDVEHRTLDTTSSLDKFKYYYKIKSVLGI